MRIHRCRLCKIGQLSAPLLTFPPTPLANEFLREPQEQDVFPLEVSVCESCGHYQLTESVDPARLFTSYSYAAGHSAANIAHFRGAAEHQAKSFNLKAGNRVLDIASNDGTLLRAFKDLGMEILGIDPAQNLALEANQKGIPTLAEFFTAVYAETVKKEHGVFDLVTANNVFAHVPDLEDFTKGVKIVLANEGVFSFEVSYFLDVCNKMLFDTIYHEHSSYHTVTPLLSFFEKLELELFDVEHLPNHGGSIRVYVRHRGASVSGPPGGTERVKEYIDAERSVAQSLENVKEKIAALGKELQYKLLAFKAEGKSIAGYGAPAKATTLMYAFGLDASVVDFVVEDSPLKQGTYTPGTHIPILPSSALAERKPDVLLLLAWNFADSIIEKNPAFRGTWVVPLPELRIITT